MPDLKHVVIGGGKPATSGLTGRELLINTDSTRFRVPASFTAEGVSAAERALMAVLDAMPDQRERRRAESSPDWRLLEAALTARTPAALAEAVDPIAAALLAGVNPKRFGGSTPLNLSRGPLVGRGVDARAVQLLTVLWRHGCLLAPLFEPRLGLFFGSRWLPYRSHALYGAAANLLATARAQEGETKLAKVEGCVSRLLLVVNGVQEIGDLSEEVLSVLAEASRERDAETQASVDALVPGLFQYTMKWGQKTFRHACNEIARAQRISYADNVAITAKVPQTYATLRPERLRARARVDAVRTRDQAFSWVGREFPECAAWQPMLAEFLTTRDGILDLRPFLAHLTKCARAILASTSPPSTPVDACRHPRQIAALIQEELEASGAKPVTCNAHVNALREFFGWVIAVKARRADGTLDPALGNPADLVRNFGRHIRKAQTDRPTMPSWLLQKAAEIVCGNDYEWPRSRQTDYFEVVEDGEVKRVWNPVLAELTRLRFVLPIRGTQARLLGSGEGDTWVWEPGDDSQPPGAEGGGERRALTLGRWVRNESEWAPPSTEERALGFLRRIYDPEQGTWTNGLYISTNKTADRAKAFAKLGYEIPWVNAEILGIYTRVLRFQQRYNPPKEPKSRAELSMEPAIINDALKALLPKMHYLFRDASHASSADEPVTIGRVQGFWNELIAELERRCAADPDIPRNPDGTALRLVERWSEQGKPSKVKYDMHSVRVTGITRLALGGCPVQVLMMLAGHATWIMTLYYVKMAPGDVRRALDEAEARLEELDATDLEEALASTDPEKLRALRFSMSDEGLAQLRDADEALMASSDLGLCPNGATLCHIGGKPVRTSSASAAIFGPVPGGPANCQSCRFLVSGPQYAGGVIARLNAQSIKVLAAGERLYEAQEQRRALVAERRRAGSDASPALLRRVRRAVTNVEAAEAHSEDVSERWQNLHRLFNRCLKALQELMRREDAGENAGGRHLLVLNGTVADVQCALHRCADVDLWRRVCADSEVYDVDATEAAAKFGMRLDHLLAQSGRPAVFAGLTDRERVTVGNAVGRWLETRLGSAGADEIYAGRRTLAEAGLLDDLDTVLPHSAHSVPGNTLLPQTQPLLPSATA